MKYLDDRILETPSIAIGQVIKEVLHMGNLAKKDSLKEKTGIISRGVLLAGSCRFIIHFLSGMIFFADYAPKGQPVWLYSLVYNSSYMIPETVITLVVMVILNKALVSNNSLTAIRQES